MQTVTSFDGTRIAFWRSGHGPPLLLVHGATADHTTTWRFVLPALELVGGDSPARELANAKGVVNALPDARLVVLPRQQHLAMYTAPDVFVSEVVKFLEE